MVLGNMDFEYPRFSSVPVGSCARLAEGIGPNSVCRVRGAGERLRRHRPQAAATRRHPEARSARGRLTWGCLSRHRQPGVGCRLMAGTQVLGAHLGGRASVTVLKVSNSAFTEAVRVQYVHRVDPVLGNLALPVVGGSEPSPQGALLAGQSVQVEDRERA